MYQSRSEKVIVILGIRSGTSLLAGMLNQMGIWFGNDMLGENIHNMTGYFENPEYTKLLKRVLALASEGRDDSRFYSVPTEKQIDWLIKESPENIMGEVAELQRETENKARHDMLWGFKAPMIGLAGKVIHPYLKNPCYIYCIRDKKEIAHSLAEVQKGHDPKLGKHDWHKWVEMYDRRARKFLKDKKHLVLNFEDILNEPLKQLIKVERFLDWRFKDKEEAVKMVNPAFSRHRS